VEEHIVEYRRIIAELREEVKSLRTQIVQQAAALPRPFEKPRARSPKKSAYLALRDTDEDIAANIGSMKSLFKVRCSAGLKLKLTGAPQPHRAACGCGGGGAAGAG
jgi:hypothetical protein